VRAVASAVAARHSSSRSLRGARGTGDAAGQDYRWAFAQIEGQLPPDAAHILQRAIKLEIEKL